MSTDLTALKAYFSKLELEPEIGTLYLVLCIHGPQTIAGLMRHSGVERTRIYRLREAMEKSNLFEIILDNKREIFKAAPIDNLQILLSKKEEQLRNLQSEFDALHELYSMAHLTSPLTHVQFYRGLEGIKQVFWNQTRAQGEVLCILDTNMQSHVGSTFFNRWVRKCNERHIHFRGIVSDNFQNEQQKWYKTRRNERLEFWEQRSVPSSVLNITHSTVIQDDLVIYYSWGEREVYGIEIYNTEIAKAQQHFFELLWQQGKSAKDVDVPKGIAGMMAGLHEKVAKAKGKD